MNNYMANHMNPRSTGQVPGSIQPTKIDQENRVMTQA